MKLAELAITAIATTTLLASLTTLPAQAQDCLRAGSVVICRDSNGQIWRTRDRNSDDWRSPRRSDRQRRQDWENRRRQEERRRQDDWHWRNRRDDNGRWNDRDWDDDWRNPQGRYQSRYYRELNQIYQEVLGRNADERGLRTYSRELERGRSWAYIRREIAESNEAAQAINRLYREVLGRDADRNGLRTYQRHLADGWSLRDVQRSLQRSDEARSR
jgi:hypothetical protein